MMSGSNSWGTENAVTVSKLVQYIKSQIENEFSEVMVEGEVSNFSQASSGHIYFSLSDSEASLSVVMFKTDVLRNKEVSSLKDGDKIILQKSTFTAGYDLEVFKEAFELRTRVGGYSE